MDARDVGGIPEGDDWQYEPKLDSYRIILVKLAGKLVLFSRRGHVFNARFPRLAKALEAIPGSSFTLDGEVVVSVE